MDPSGNPPTRGDSAVDGLKENVVQNVAPQDGVVKHVDAPASTRRSARTLRILPTDAHNAPAASDVAARRTSRSGSRNPPHAAAAGSDVSAEASERRTSGVKRVSDAAVLPRYYGAGDHEHGNDDGAGDSDSDENNEASDDAAAVVVPDNKRPRLSGVSEAADLNATVDLGFSVEATTTRDAVAATAAAETAAAAAIASAPGPVVVLAAPVAPVVPVPPVNAAVKVEAVHATAPVAAAAPTVVKAEAAAALLPTVAPLPTAAPAPAPAAASAFTRESHSALAVTAARVAGAFTAPQDARAFARLQDTIASLARSLRTVIPLAQRATIGCADAAAAAEYAAVVAGLARAIVAVSGAGEGEAEDLEAATVAATAAAEAANAAAAAVSAHPLPVPLPFDADLDANAQLRAASRRTSSAAAIAAATAAAHAPDVHLPQSAVEMLMQRERGYPLTDYLEQQPQITANMRAVLADWMREVSLEHRVGVETYYIAVRLVDRLLSAVPVPRKELQLVGAACVLLAAKLEELQPLPIRNFEMLCDNLYTRSQFLTMESVIMRKLAFRCHSPTIATYVSEFFNVSQASPALRQAVEYVMCLIALDYPVSQLPVAAAAAATMLLVVDHFSALSAADAEQLRRRLVRALPPALRAQVPAAAATVAAAWSRIHSAIVAYIADPAPAPVDAPEGEAVPRDTPQCKSAYDRFAAEERFRVSQQLRMPTGPADETTALLESLPYVPGGY